MRGSVGWSYEAFNAQFFMNYTGPYINGASPDNPVTTDPVTGNLNGGGDKVKAGTTFDANFVYQFDDGFLGNDKISLNIRNVFDQRPPFYSSAGGYNSGVSSPLGRLITIGITSQF
jgi:outer membrane receptor protein involved in Fe transport